MLIAGVDQMEAVVGGGLDGALGIQTHW